MTINSFGIYITLLISSFVGTAFFTYEVGPLSVFPYRIILVLSFIYIISRNNRSRDTCQIVLNMSYFFYIWLLYALISVLWAVDTTSAIKHISYLLTNTIVLYVTVSVLDTTLKVWDALKLWIICFVSLLPVALWELTTGNHLPSSGLNYVDIGYEFARFAPTTTFYNQNDYATLIGITFPLLLSVTIHSRRLSVKLLIILTLFITLYVLIYTTSRANILAIIVSILFLILLQKNIKTKILILFLISISVFASIFMIPSKFKDGIQNVAEDITELSTGTQDYGIEVRYNLILNGLVFVKNSGGFGVGAGNAEYYMENRNVYPVANITNIHNWFFEVLVNYGILILLLYTLVLLSLFRQLLIIYKKTLNTSDRMISEGFLCVLVAFPISSMSTSSLTAFNPFWILFAIMIAFVNATYRITK